MLAIGRVGTSYMAAVGGAQGGTPPYTWTIASGSLPSGLSLSPTGVIQGTPAAAATHSPLTIQVHDSGNPVLTAATRAELSVNPATLSVSLSSSRLGLTASQQASLSAVTNDVAGVTWSINPSGASYDQTAGTSGLSRVVFSQSTSHSGVDITLTVPTGPALYTVTATSISDYTVRASATVAVTDLDGVYTYHNDLGRTGANLQEYALTPANVNAGSFGKLFSCTVDGAIYAQPLWVANLAVAGASHNVVFVATEHDSVFAFDADHSPCERLWSASMTDTAHGAGSGETSVPSAGPDALVGSRIGDLTPETGITGTPVIDPATGTLYVVSKSVDSTGTRFNQRLHALDITSGAEKAGSPVTITGTYPGAGDGGTTVTFNARTQLQRAALALVNGTVLITWSAHEDTPPYYGWLMGYRYDGASFTQTQVLNVTPNVGGGGIWMSGAAPAADDRGNLYLLTGNGPFDADTAGPLANNDYGDTLLQISEKLAISQYFTPSDQLLGETQDLDFGSGGAAVLVDLPSGSPMTHLITGGGKDGTLYVLNRDALGGYGDEHAWQMIPIGGPLLSTPAFWNNSLYIGGIRTALQEYQIDPATARFSAASSSALTAPYGIGVTPSVSASGTSNGIVWILDNANPCRLNESTTALGGPAVLEAHDAANVANLLWSSAASEADRAGNAVRFTVPTIANGKVYVATRGTGAASCSLTATTGELDVYGLK